MPPNLVSRPNQQSPVRFTGDFTPKQQADVLVATDLILCGRGDFARQVAEHLELTEVSAYKRPEDEKMHVEVVFEIDMDEGTCPVFYLLLTFISNQCRIGMLNIGGNLHGGCTMFMIDMYVHLHVSTWGCTDESGNIP